MSTKVIQLPPKNEYIELHRTILVYHVSGAVSQTLGIELDFEHGQCALMMVSPDACLFKMKMLDIATCEQETGMSFGDTIRRIIHGETNGEVFGVLAITKTVIQSLDPNKLLDWVATRGGWWTE